MPITRPAGLRYVVVAYFMVFSCLFLAWLVFGYVCRGSLLDVAIFTFAHIVVMASFGLIISNYSQNVQQAMFVIWFFSIIFMLMSGIFLKGCTLADIWKDLACLAGVGLFTTTWAVLSYRKTC